MMFGGILRAWREARGRALRAELEDAIARLAKMPPSINLICSTTFVQVLSILERHRGPIENIGANERRRAAKYLSQQARERFKVDIGGAYGTALASALVEAGALPGPDAAFVLAKTTSLRRVALEIADRLKATDEAAEKLEELTTHCRKLGARGPREVAEMLVGRPIPDGEWARYREPLELAWRLTR